MIDMAEKRGLVSVSTPEQLDYLARLAALKKEEKEKGKLPRKKKVEAETLSEKLGVRGS